MREETVVKITAVLCLTGIGIAALSQGIDSVLISAISAIIGGIAGYEIGRKKEEG